MSLKMLLLLACLASLAYCQSKCNDPARLDMFGLINVLYFKADPNRDNVISESELDDIWHGFDQNGDQIVTAAEFIPSWAAVTTMTQEMSTAYFYLADLDNSGQITASDLHQVYTRFDLDGDGRVSAQEFNVKWQQLYREAPFAVMFLRADTNKNDALQQTEFGRLFSSFAHNADGSVRKSGFETGWSGLTCGTVAEADVIFDALDSNHDSILMTSEMEHEFPHYDTNHNGSVELLELLSMIVTAVSKPVG